MTEPRRKQVIWEASEYARLLHVLIDARTTVAHQQLLCPLTREDLDVVTVDPWDEHISPLYNENQFALEVIRTLAGGVTRSEIFAIDPVPRPHTRDTSTFKSKFSQLKSMYSTSISRFQVSGQQDGDNLPAF